ncbi:p-hydroxycinnamoyl CoA hydratase/lyase [Muricoccus aerilatus]|uniref:p-hydroxycinnamoyl CoA hydratase/lyase n=1 Tax=Muricoccus aerilatus TaxID=452982 RepID=UPI0005C18810|nr:p-hydroxycinnamoyl CoA hydratase/lyase [Roseomonas aerilata]
MPETPSWETIALSREEGGIAVLTLNRPAKRNAMNPRMNEEAAAALEVLRYDAEARVVVLTGAGEAFCGGMDIKEFLVGLKDKPDEYDRIDRLTYEWRARTLRRFPKPVIAMVNGWTFGGGVSLVESCDLAIAAEDATFGVSEINFGMFPAGPVTRSLTRLARPRDGLLHAMTGRPFDGRAAERMGLVNLAVPRASLRDETFALAREIASKDPHALRATKESFWLTQEMSHDAAQDYVSAKYHELTQRQGGSWREKGAQGFLDKAYKPGLGGRSA